MWRSPVPNFTQIGEEIWKLQVEILLHHCVKYNVHCAKFREPMLAQQLL